MHRIWDSMDAANKAVTVGALAFLAVAIIFAILFGMTQSYRRSEAQARLNIGLALGEINNKKRRK